MEKYTGVEQIVRRKAKRIEKSRVLLYQLIQHIKHFSSISDVDKERLEDDIKYILEYVKNDDKEENKYNKDNYNG